MHSSNVQESEVMISERRNNDNRHNSRRRHCVRAYVVRHAKRRQDEPATAQREQSSRAKETAGQNQPARVADWRSVQLDMRCVNRDNAQLAMAIIETISEATAKSA